MTDGYIRVAAITPKVTVADTKANGEEIRNWIEKAAKQGAKVMVFPELCITGYTCGELFYQQKLQNEALIELRRIADATISIDALVFVGLPLMYQGHLRNVAAALCHGRILGFVPKKHLPNYNEFYELRYFTPGPVRGEDVVYHNHTIPIGEDLIFSCENVAGLKVGAEICEDLWVPNPPSTALARAGATVIVNLSASDELTGKSGYRRNLVVDQSARLYCGYLYANAGSGESTQDVVYSGHSMIAENGRLLSQTKPFEEGMCITELDLDAIASRRSAMNTFEISSEGYRNVAFRLEPEKIALTRFVDPHPFVPGHRDELSERCEEILNIQAYGLRKRLEHTHCKTAVIGISGGLDSTLALLVTVRAFDLLSLDRKGILAVTMPGFGTTDRTHDNAVQLIHELKATFREVNIAASVRQHFADIDHDEAVHDVTYENGQARERTQILMDLANKHGGMVIGTGDLSELALGWATYNGDHMSMYGVNASVPKTLVRHLVAYVAAECENKAPKLREILLDVLDTPVSPELLPPKEGEIAQKTEDLVGPYELHDFFLYYVMRYGFTPSKIYRLAQKAFQGVYEDEVIKKWLVTFYRRFFSQQFKRSALPDGPKVGSVALSPRGDWRMPSDASGALWITEAEEL
ncbi:MAG: NAD(+) synthase [Lachnospiraceae bacterium]|jgi:NAD+ synthase (glutamine-hydrolysing)|nr:NAD(+) synthase [Lachnospiraceae bacterium]